MRYIYIKSLWNRIERRIISQGNGDDVYLNFVKEIFFKNVKEKKIEFAYVKIENFKCQLFDRICATEDMITRQYLLENVIEPIFDEFKDTIKKRILSKEGLPQ